jgi:hypothetical protein
LQGPVRISIPANVANDLSSLKTAITKVVERLGCRPCFSGADCLFHLERDFVVDPAVQIHPLGRFSGLDPDGDPARQRRVTVGLAGPVSDNLDRVLNAVEKVVGRLGCSPCCSGFDIAFRREIDQLIIDQDQNLHAFGPSF